MAGYDTPKPLIDVRGKPMIQWVVDNMNLAGATYIFIVRQEHLDKAEWRLRERLQELVPGCVVVATDRLTEGPACSVLLAEPHLRAHAPLLIANADQFLEWDAAAFLYCSARVDGSISVFHQPDPTDRKWSYVARDAATGLVTEAREKEPISDMASTGVYYWKRAGDFVRYAKDMIAANERVNNEFYVCPVYNHAIRDRKRIVAIPCERMWGLGVPADLEAFLRDYAPPRAGSSP